MQYRHIQFTDPRDLEEHINLLRNFQDIHMALVKLPNNFPVLELSDVVPNYEHRYNSFVAKGNKIIYKFQLENFLTIINADFTVGGFSAEKLISRKEFLIDTLETTIDTWQSICDKIDKEKRNI